MQFTFSPDMSSTTNSRFPSSTKIVPFISASKWMPGGATLTRVLLPTRSLLVKVILSFSASSNAPGSVGPVRYLAPGTSTIIPTGIPNSSDTFLTLLKTISWTLLSPWDILRRATFIPVLINSIKTSSVSEEGPRVQTIFVLGLP